MSDGPRACQAAVSFEDEPLIVVDEHDRVLAYRSKADCHDGGGILHRAFSVFLFDRWGRVLLQQRSREKRLWPLTWSSACCSHPRRGETMAAAARRRLHEELGVTCDLEFLFRFQYHAAYEDEGSEFELCSVFVGHGEEPIRAHAGEVAALAWVEAEALDRALVEDPERHTPWLRMEWARMRHEFADRLAPYLAARDAGPALPA